MTKLLSPVASVGVPCYLAEAGLVVLGLLRFFENSYDVGNLFLKLWVRQRTRKWELRRMCRSCDKLGGSQSGGYRRTNDVPPFDIR